MQLSHAWTQATPLFDDDNLVPCAGLAPVMALAEQADLSKLVTSTVTFTTTSVASAGTNPGRQTRRDPGQHGRGRGQHRRPQHHPFGRDATTVQPGLRTRHAGQFLREFTHGHSLQVASVARAHLVNLVTTTDLLPGIEQQAYVDIDSLPWTPVSYPGAVVDPDTAN